MPFESFRQAASDEGFTLLGVTPAIAPDGTARLFDWIDAGYAAGMTYFQDRREAYGHPSSVLPGVRSIIALATPYPSAERSAIKTRHGRVARYAWSGDDYHDVIHPKLKRLCRSVTDGDPDATARGVVDTAPIAEREFAQLAGLGWRGKNTLLLRPRVGSYFFLSLILTSRELVYDQSFESFHCGTCTACLDACPTNAFPQPGVLDASKCISYLTIEHRDAIPESLRPMIGDWLFGCDVCQEVCPWNAKTSRDQPSPDEFPLATVELTSLFAMDEDAFRLRFRKTAFWRTRRRGLLRNAAIVLGNTGDASALNALRTGASDTEEIVREASRWAIGQIEARERSDIGQSGT